jgi:hypothetical protein
MKNEVEFGTVKVGASPAFPSEMKESSPNLGVVNLIAGDYSVAEIPEVSDVKTFRYLFRCGHCGHEWTEERTKFTSGRVEGEYKGD